MTKDEIRNWTILELKPHYGLVTRPIYGMAYYGAIEAWFEIAYDRSMIERWRHGTSQDSQEAMQADGKGEVSESRSRHSSNSGGCA